MSSFTYYAPNISSRFPTPFFIAGSTSAQEKYTSTAVYSYSKGDSEWSTVRNSVSSNTVSEEISIQNDFNGVVYTLTRTGVQFSTTWGIVPAGIRIAFSLDTFTLPEGGTLKIQAFKGTSTALTGIPSEFAIPLNQGLIPYSNEIEINDATSDVILYFNQTAINDFIANPDQNLFILGEYDYNNIAPTDKYAAGDSQGSNVTLEGIT
jgi:hypothetical protein